MSMTSLRCTGQAFEHHTLVQLDQTSTHGEFPLVRRGRAAAIYLDPEESGTLGGD